MVVLCGIMLAGVSFAGMNDRDYDFSVIGTATGSVSYVLRGELEGIYVDIAAGSTQTVTVASDEQTLFTKSVTADAWYPVLYAAYGSTGSALTFASYGGTAGTPTITTNSVIVYGEDDAAIATNTILTYAYAPSTTATSNPIYTKAPMAGPITVTVVGTGTSTNATKVTVVYNQ